MATLPRALGSFASDRRLLFSVYHGVLSTTHSRPQLSHARLVRPSGQQRWNHSKDWAPPRHEVERLYDDFKLPRAASYRDIKKMYHDRCKLYHSDIVGNDPEAKELLQESRDLFDLFTIIHENGHKAKVDQEILDLAENRLKGFFRAAEVSRAQKIQKEKDRTIKKAQKQEMGKTNPKHYKIPEHLWNFTIASAKTIFQKDAVKARIDPRKHQPEEGPKSAQQETKQSPLPYERKVISSKLQAIRERDIRDRSRIILLQDIPSWASLLDICNALATFKPGAVYACRLQGSAARLEFFHSYAAYKVLDMVKSGRMVVTRHNETTAERRSAKITSAKLELAAGKTPITKFPYRVLEFYAGPSNPAMTPAYFRDCLKRYGVSTRLVGSKALSGRLAISFASVKDAETANGIFQRHHPEVKITYFLDNVGPVAEPSGVGNLAKNQKP